MRWNPLTLCAAAITSTIAQAAAENWYLIAKMDKGAEYLDLRSVQPTGTERVFRLKIVLAKPIGNTASMEVGEHINCSANTIVDLGYRFFDGDGKVVGGNVNMSGDPPKQIQSKSDQMTIRNLVC